MSQAFLILWLIVLSLFPAFPRTGAETETPSPTPTISNKVTPQDLIDMVNTKRADRGLRNLIVDPILMINAQESADIMALNQMDWHVGNAKERAIAKGYGANDIPWLTENFAIGGSDWDRETTLAAIKEVWADDLHMLPATANYTFVGAGVAEYDGAVYYILQAGYTSDKIYKPGATAVPGAPTAAAVSQIIYPVKLVTPQADGKVVHEVKQGQSLWSIAIAYGTKINAIVGANNLSPDSPTIYTGQKLIIPVTLLPPTPTLAPLFTPEAPLSATEEPVRANPIVATNIVPVYPTPLPWVNPTPTPAPTPPEASSMDVLKIFLFIIVIGIPLLYIFWNAFAKKA